MRTTERRGNSPYGSNGGSLARLAIAVAVISLIVPMDLSGQGRISFEPHGGITIPTGQLASAVDAGPSLGMRASYDITRRVGLDVGAGVDLMDGASLAGDAQAPDLRVWRLTGGLFTDFLPSDRWALIGSVAVGAADFGSDRFTPAGGSSETFDHTYFTGSAGLKLGVAMSSRITGYVGAAGVWTAVDEDDSRRIAALDESRIEAFGSSFSVPINVGFRVKLGGGRRAQVASEPTSRPRPTPAPSVDRESEARSLCVEAERALESGDYERARALLRQAASEYAGTTCANSVPALLARVADVEILRQRIHFDFDRSFITDAGARVLQAKADVLRRYPDLRITIEGHCDERGSLEYNQALGYRRAEATQQYLRSLGISEGMFRLVTFGEERPLVPLQSEAAWSENRRAEFVLANLGAIGAR